MIARSARPPSSRRPWRSARQCTPKSPRCVHSSSYILDEKPHGYFHADRGIHNVFVFDITSLAMLHCTHSHSCMYAVFCRKPPTSQSSPAIHALRPAKLPPERYVLNLLVSFFHVAPNQHDCSITLHTRSKCMLTSQTATSAAKQGSQTGGQTAKVCPPSLTIFVSIQACLCVNAE